MKTKKREIWVFPDRLMNFSWGDVEERIQTKGQVFKAGEDWEKEEDVSFCGEGFEASTRPIGAMDHFSIGPYVTKLLVEAYMDSASDYGVYIPKEVTVLHTPVLFKIPVWHLCFDLLMGILDHAEGYSLNYTEEAQEVILNALNTIKTAILEAKVRMDNGDGNSLPNFSDLYDKVQFLSIRPGISFVYYLATPAKCLLKENESFSYYFDSFLSNWEAYYTHTQHSDYQINRMKVQLNRKLEEAFNSLFID